MSDDQYVHADPVGSLRVGDARIPLESVWVAYEQGETPEAIHSQYPSLQLNEIYGAIAFGLSHPGAVSDYMKKQDRLWRDGRRKSQARPSPVVQRLRAAKKASLVEGNR